MTPLKTQAIQTALTGDWTSAIALNQELLTESPEDIDTLNRLAFAYMSAGNSKDAKETYQKVLALDIKNPIALRNLRRLSSGTQGNPQILQPTMMANLFIEESGKTKVIDLINVADKKVIAPLRSGEPLLLSVKRMKIFILDNDKQYIGMLPDDLSKRLIKFINSGNDYEAYVKTVNSLKVTVFVRETKRASKFKNQPSFPSGDKSKFTLDNKNHAKPHKSHEENDDDDAQDESEEELL